MLYEYKKYVIDILSVNTEIKSFLENTNDISAIEYKLADYINVMSYHSFIKKTKIDELFNL